MFSFDTTETTHVVFS